MPRKKRKARVSKRRVTVTPVYRDKIDTQALAKALVDSVTWQNRQAADDQSDPDAQRRAS